MVDAIEFRSRGQATAPFILAITLE
jgi:hypothetical protein